MGNHAKSSNVFSKFLHRLYVSYIPNKRDNLKQIILKVLFIICFIALIVSVSYIANYFLEANKQDSIVNDSRNLWHETAKKIPVSNENGKKELSEAAKKLLAENGDFKGWIKLSNTKIDNPIYQTDNNNFYLNHNQQKKRSVYGALYFDYKNKITENETDKNLVIYGHEMKNGSMFGNLKKLKNLNFYKQNPVIEFSTLYKDSTYKVYAIFVLNAVKSDDNGKIYNIYRQNFLGEDDFNAWVQEAYERSIINTGVDVLPDDNIITLVTCTNDFKNARLVVMARETRDGESKAVDTSNATVNPKPRYPAKWYETKGISK